MFKNIALLILIASLGACASLNAGAPEAPPEYNQKVQLIVSEDYEKFQAPRSRYDLGDLQAFHSQHTLPIKVEAAFQEIFGSVETLKADEPRLSMAGGDEPPVFEVQMIDMTHDNFEESLQYYRGSATLAAAMKSPRGEIVWQQAFRGDGFVNVDTEFGFSMGPEEALIMAVDDAIAKMQDAIVQSPQIRLYMKAYAGIEEARQQTESKV